VFKVINIFGFAYFNKVKDSEGYFWWFKRFTTEKQIAKMNASKE